MNIEKRCLFVPKSFCSQKRFDTEASMIGSDESILDLGLEHTKQQSTTCIDHPLRRKQKMSGDDDGTSVASAIAGCTMSEPIIGVQ